MHILKKSLIYLFLVMLASSLLRGPFSSCGKWGPPSRCSMQASLCSGLSALLQARALGHAGFGSYDPQAQ